MTSLVYQSYFVDTAGLQRVATLTRLLSTNRTIIAKSLDIQDGSVRPYCTVQPYSRTVRQFWAFLGTAVCLRVRPKIIGVLCTILSLQFLAILRDLRTRVPNLSFGLHLPL